MLSRIRFSCTLAFCAILSSSAAGRWQSEVIAGPTDDMLLVSMRLDAAGDPHIASIHRTQGVLYYTTRRNGEWSSEIVASIGGPNGIFTSIALSPDETPAIAYWHVGQRNLQLATREQVGWRIEDLTAVDSGAGVRGALGFQLDGSAVVAYCDELGSFFLARQNAGSWAHELIEQGPRPGAVELAVDSLNRIHVVYGFENFHEHQTGLYYWFDGASAGQLAGLSAAPSLRRGPGQGALLSYADRELDTLVVRSLHESTALHEETSVHPASPRCIAAGVTDGGRLVAAAGLSRLRLFGLVDGYWPWLEHQQVVGFTQSFAMDLAPQDVVHVVSIGHSRTLDYATLDLRQIEPPSIVEFSVDNAVIDEGESATLHWSMEGTELGLLEPELGFVTSAEGSMEVSPTVSTDFTLTAMNLAGTVQAQTTLQVNPDTTPATIVGFSIDDMSIIEGETATLRWNTSHADEVWIDPGIGVVPESGWLFVSPSQTTTYQITASNDYGTDTRQRTILVTPAPPPVIREFDVSDAVIVQGESTTLTWRVDFADAVTIQPTLGPVSDIGSAFVSPQTTTTYVLTATSQRGTSQASREVVVVPPGPLPTIVQLELDEERILIGEGTFLRFAVANATLVQLQPLGVETVSEGGAFELQPEQTTTYTFVASNALGSVSADVTLVVDPFRLEYFQAQRSYIGRLESGVLSWSVVGQPEVELVGFGPQPSSGQQEVSPQETREYTLIVRGGGQEEQFRTQLYVGEFDRSTLALSWLSESYLTVAPPVPAFTPFEVHLLGISLDRDLAGLEFRLNLPSGLVLLDTRFEVQQPVNLGVGSDFIVGLGECVRALHDLEHLATFELLATDVSELEQKVLTLGPIDAASIPGSASYASCADELLEIASGLALPLSGEGASVPVLDLEFAGRRVGGAIELSWSVVAGSAISRFEVVRILESRLELMVASIPAAAGQSEWRIHDANASNMESRSYVLRAYGKSGLLLEKHFHFDPQPGMHRLRLLANQPNPFNPSTLLRFEAARPGRHALALYDISGRQVARFELQADAPGIFEQLWDGRDGQGRTVASGVYHVRLNGPGGSDNQRILLLK